MIANEDIERRPLGAIDTPAPAAYRAIQILDVLSQAAVPLTLTEIALAIGLPKSSTSNLLVTLDTARMVRRTERGWLVGYKALEIGQSVLVHTDIVQEFRRHVARKEALSSETVLLAVREGLQIIYLARSDGTQHVRLASDIGRRMPAVVTSLGKAMLAELDDESLDEQLSLITTLPRPTMQSHATVDALRTDLIATRARGFAVDFEQNTIGVTCFGVALHGAAVPTAVSTTLLTHRATPALREQLVRELQDLARDLEAYAR